MSCMVGYHGGTYHPRKSLRYLPWMVGHCPWMVESMSGMQHIQVGVHPFNRIACVVIPFSISRLPLQCLSDDRPNLLSDASLHAPIFPPWYHADVSRNHQHRVEAPTGSSCETLRVNASGELIRTTTRETFGIYGTLSKGLKIQACQKGSESVRQPQ